MVTQPAYLKNLKAYARGPQDRTNVAALMGAFQAESDRGAIILTATSLEDILEWGITARMPNLMLDSSIKDSIFGINGSVGTFSNKIQMAYALGLIDRQARNEIDLIREMRNACAHSRKPISLDQPALKAVCLQVLGEVGTALTTDTATALRLAFMLKATMLEEQVVSGKRISIAATIKRFHESASQSSTGRPPQQSNRGDP